MKLQLSTLTLLGAFGATSALAATTATSVTDLNLRAAPGPNAEIIDVIPNEGEVALDGCIDGSNWCQVTYDGTSGWAYGAYLTGRVEGEPKVVIENRDVMEIGTVTYEDKSGESAAVGAGALSGALVGGAIGGPVGAVAGAGVGGIAGGAANPDEDTIVYVREHAAEPVYLEGEVVVGARIPQDVVLQEVPDAEYAYAYVNGVPVLVDPAKRDIVYIVR